MDVREIETAILACKEKVDETKEVIDKKVFELDRAHYITAKEVIEDCLEKIDEALECCNDASNELVFKEIDAIMSEVKNNCIEVRNNIIGNISLENVDEVPSNTEEIPVVNDKVQEVEEFSNEDVDNLLNNMDEDVTLEEQQKVMEDLDRFINEDLDLTPMDNVNYENQINEVDNQPISSENMEAFNLEPISLDNQSESIETPIDTTPINTIADEEPNLNEFNFEGIDDNGLDNLFAEEAVDSLRLSA